MGNKSNNILSLRRTIRGLISEIDWADTFSDVQQKCLNPKEIVDYLNKVRANAFLDYKDRFHLYQNLQGLKLDHKIFPRTHKDL